MAWTAARIAECLALWRADLKAMALGAYTAPLAHPEITDDRRVFSKRRKPRVPRPPQELVHSRGGYVRGCRCDVCREAARIYMRAYHARRRAMRV